MFIYKDFIFQNISAEQSVISSITGTSTTTINYLGLYFTTLELQSEDNILSIIKELRWDSSSEDISPEWFWCKPLSLHQRFYHQQHKFSLCNTPLNFIRDCKNHY